ncbi:Ribulose-phosphate 3-epimerase [Polystyrenella longa]|uniref:Ribulose-phosphate 3-epimerase n=1 Tax=Polystyrenella longa TaxID=2528007 RepID=A0A518CU38_9PLAN|nr:ribulose-phosphate 3-epimerase [Polystyrenella longa]QDU82746.1 Ribulose-phosphate 3-epimerase [Polystyrenella longa]
MDHSTRKQKLRACLPTIAPSMLKCDYGNLQAEIEQLTRDGAQVLHWDVMDGHFVPNLSYGALLLKSLRNKTDLFYDAHLMISDPDRYLDDYLDAGCDAITFHIEAVPEPTALLKRIKDAGVLAGLSFNPQTPVSAIEPFFGETDLVLLMSVEPGFGGQSFIESSVEKMQQLRTAAGLDVILSIDGGIGPDTLSGPARSGADLYVAGSSVFGEEDYGVAIREMETLARDQGPTYSN